MHVYAFSYMQIVCLMWDYVTSSKFTTKACLRELLSSRSDRKVSCWYCLKLCCFENLLLKNYMFALSKKGLVVKLARSDINMQ